MNNFKNNLFYIITALIMIITYIVVQPKVMPLLFNIRRNDLLDAFIANTIKNKRVDVQEFWKMREFYCPGSYIFDKTKNPFLVYRCKWMNSQDSLNSEVSIVNNNALEQKYILFQNKTTVIYRNRTQVIISFSAQEQEMKKAIGYFDYGEKDKELVKGKFWENITYISL